MARPISAGMYRRVAGLFTAAFLLGLIVLALLGHFGLPAELLGPTLGGAILVTFAVVGIQAGTLDLSEFQLASRNVSAAANGMASAAAVMGGAIYLGLAGVFLADVWTGAAITAGWTLGCVILAVGVAPYIRKSGAFGIADFLGLRFKSRRVRAAAAVAVAIALVAALGAALAMGVYVATLFFGVSSGMALAIVAGVVMVSTLFGGMRALTVTAIIQYVVLAIAFLVPLAVVSVQEFFVPLPQFTFGFAFDKALLLQEATGDVLATPRPGSFLALHSGNGPALVAAILSLAAGVAVLPHLAIRTATVARVHEARRSAGWTLFFFLVVALAAPAYAAFTQLIVMRDLAGTGLERLPDWIFAYGPLGWIGVCGTAPGDAIAAIEACRAAGSGFTGNLAAADLTLSGDGVVLGGPALFELPYVATALVATGALAAAIAAANAIAFTIASAIANDLYGNAIATHVSAGRQLIVTRVAIVLVVLAGAWLAASQPGDLLGLMVAAVALSAGGLFPAVILGIWWKRTTATGALAGIAAGTLVTLVIVIERHAPGFLPLGAINPARLGFDELTAAIIGVPVGIIATVATSLAAAPPEVTDDARIDAIRRPGGTPFVHETES